MYFIYGLFMYIPSYFINFLEITLQLCHIQTVRLWIYSINSAKVSRYMYCNYKLLETLLNYTHLVHFNSKV